MENKSGKNTLLMSVIMSSPGPIVVGLGLIVGQSSTQLADFVRRSVELMAIIISFVIYCITNKNGNTDRKKKNDLEKKCNMIVGIAMIISGLIMFFLAILSPNEEKGNVIPGLVIALLGVIANSIFWMKYTKLSKETNNSILTVQSKLYRAKTFVDISVTTALLVVMLFPTTKASFYFDIIGTILVSIYLFITGLQTCRKSNHEK